MLMILDLVYQKNNNINMSMKELVNKIKLFLAEEAIAPIEFKDVKTADGQILSYDGDLAIGVEVFIVDENGRTPAPDGKYMLEDGTKLDVVAGKVESMEVVEPVGTPPAEAPPIEPMASAAPTTTTTTTVQTIKASLEERLDKLELENAEMKKILSTLAESLSKKVFVDEVKASIIKVDNTIEKMAKPEVVVNSSIVSRNSNLNNIFRNMYKNGGQ